MDWNQKTTEAIIRLGLLLLTSCQAPTPPISSSNKEAYQLDTFVERNNPAALDLTQHQLFIDTTRDSEFYQNLTHWQPPKYNKRDVQTYLTTLTKAHQPKKMNWGNFPTAFVEIHQQGEEFIVYDRCDGIDTRYELRDSAVIFYGPLESDAAIIKQLLYPNNKGIKLELYTPRSDSNIGVATLAITPTKMDFIYQLEYKDEYLIRQHYIIPIEAIPNFDLLVNHCPNTKVTEYPPLY